MLFLFFQKNTAKLNICSCYHDYSRVILSYLPVFLNRIVMYFCYLVDGVRFADMYLKGEVYTFKSIRVYACILVAIIAILGLNFISILVHQNIRLPFSGFSVYRIKTFVFALLAMLAGIWNKLNWFGFNKTFEF
jgi:hypothetical protein